MTFQSFDTNLVLPETIGDWFWKDSRRFQRCENVILEEFELCYGLLYFSQVNLGGARIYIHR